MSQTGSPPTRLSSGVSTSATEFLFGNLPQPTPARINLYHNDFNTYAAGDWTVTTGGTGTSALIDGNGGLLAVTTSTLITDIQANQLVKKSYAFTANSQFWFGINFKINHASNTAMMAGVSNTFAALAPTDGVYFSKPAGAATMNLVIRAGSTSTTLTVGTVVADTYYSMGFYYDGKASPTLYGFSTIPYLNGTAPFGATGNTAFGTPYFSGGNQYTPAAGAESQAGTTLANLPTASTNLTMGWAFQAGATGATGIGTIDWVTCANEIVARF